MSVGKYEVHDFEWKFSSYLNNQQQNIHSGKKSLYIDVEENAGILLLWNLSFKPGCL